MTKSNNPHKHGGDHLATQGPALSAPTPRPEVGADAFATGGLHNDTQQQFTPGQRIAERYTVLNALGTGGMGQVYLVYDAQRNQPIALKRLHPHLAHDPVLQQRFREEIKIAQSLSHPGFLKTFGVDQDPERNEIFYLMEYLPGETLETALKTRHPHPFSLPETLAILQPLAEAIDALHRMGILHRDLKPSNIYLPHGGHPRLMDLGIARVLQDPSKHTLPTQAGIGTAYYMAPEQLRGQGISFASDIFSLGVLAYEMLTQQLPIGIPKPPSRLVPNLPKALDAALFQALDADPSERPPSATALVRTLETAQQSDPSAPHGGILGSLAKNHLETAQTPEPSNVPRPLSLFRSAPSVDSEPFDPPRSRGTWIWLSVSLVLILAGAVVAGFFILATRPPESFPNTNTPYSPLRPLRPLQPLQPDPSDNRQQQGSLPPDNFQQQGPLSPNAPPQPSRSYPHMPNYPHVPNDASQGQRRRSLQRRLKDRKNRLRNQQRRSW